MDISMDSNDPGFDGSGDAGGTYSIGTFNFELYFTSIVEWSRRSSILILQLFVLFTPDTHVYKYHCYNRQ